MILSSKILGSSGKHVLILHGFLGSGDNWISIARKIVECGFKVHLIDQRNNNFMIMDQEPTKIGPGKPITPQVVEHAIRSALAGRKLAQEHPKTAQEPPRSFKAPKTKYAANVKLRREHMWKLSFRKIISNIAFLMWQHH